MTDQERRLLEAVKELAEARAARLEVATRLQLLQDEEDEAYDRVNAAREVFDTIKREMGL